ncbi:MAG: phage holin family protein [Bacteroidales bacterium]|nr:phage holin family protein [Lentimicrobiaceae bacterium]MDD5693782.1 phage holin family protein [Bacteroidales bacterium]
MRFLVKLLISSVIILVTAYILPGVHVDSFWTALLVALVLALLNVFLKPLLIILTIPFTIITLGLFLLVINAVIILITDQLIGQRFEVDGFWWALLFSLIISLVNSLINSWKKQST